MKNNYCFNLLIKEKLEINYSQQEDIFFKMFAVLNSKHFQLSIDTIEELNLILSDSKYYIANNHIIYKGSDMFFNGKLFIASKKNLISYLENSIKQDDLRASLIAPIFDEAPEYVIYLDQDGNFFKYNNLGTLDNS